MKNDVWHSYIKDNKVKALNAKPRANIAKIKTTSRPKNRTSHDYEALSRSHNLPPSGQIEVRGEEISYLKQNYDAKALNKLKKGGFTIRDSIDLHGLSSKDAEKTVYEFIAHSLKYENLCVRIIHGKGQRSIDRHSIIKESMPTWLMRLDCVVAFCSAPRHDGGSGATYVLLK